MVHHVLNRRETFKIWNESRLSSSIGISGLFLDVAPIEDGVARVSGCIVSACRGVGRENPILDRFI